MNILNQKLYNEVKLLQELQNELAEFSETADSAKKAVTEPFPEQIFKIYSESWVKLFVWDEKRNWKTDDGYFYCRTYIGHHNYISVFKYPRYPIFFNGFSAKERSVINQAFCDIRHANISRDDLKQILAEAYEKIDEFKNLLDSKISKQKEKIYGLYNSIVESTPEIQNDDSFKFFFENEKIKRIFLKNFIGIMIE